VPVTVEETDFASFFRRQHANLVALGYAMTGSAESARDLAQEALARSFREWSRLEHYDNPATWVRRVLVNLAIDELRKRRNESAAVQRVARGEVFELREASAHEWWRAVLALPERQRAAVALHYLDDMSVTDVAAVLGVTEGTVKASLSKARRTLARTLPREVP
jgi:RNA polymerase sigma-70 factor (ECF subfamily)